MNSTVTFRAIDAAGNVGAWSTGYSLKIDKTPPPVPTVSYLAGTSAYGTGYWAAGNLTTTLSSVDGMSGTSYYQSWDGATIMDSSLAATSSKGRRF